MSTATITASIDVRRPVVVEAELVPAETTELAVLISEMNKLHAEAVHAAQVQLAAAFRLGQLLCEAKDRIGHGTFIAWVAGHCDFSQRAANNYMRLFAKFGTAERLKVETGVANLSLRRAIAYTRDRGRIIRPAECVADRHPGEVQPSVQDAIDDVDARPATPTLRAALRRVQENDRQVTRDHCSGAISQEPTESLASAGQESLARFYEQMKRVAEAVDELNTQLPACLKAANSENWTTHTETNVRNRLSGIEADLSRINRTLKGASLNRGDA